MNEGECPTAPRNYTPEDYSIIEQVAMKVESSLDFYLIGV